MSENFTTIEDGMGNYRVKAPRVRRILPNGEAVVPFGYDKRIKHVYLTARRPIPEIIKDKVITFSMFECWKHKSPKDKVAILDIFSVPMERLTELVNQGRTQIFLTQPLYIVYKGENRASMQKKTIEFYKKVLAKYDKSRIIIKVHPAEHLNYAKYFPDIPVVKEQFPMELMAFTELGEKIDRLISVHSTATYGLVDDDKVDTYANEWSNFVKTGEL